MSDTTQPSWLTEPLYKLLAKGLPAYVTPRGLDLARLAKDVGVNRATPYRWMQTGKISTSSVTQLVKLSGGKLTKEDFVPFFM